MYSHSHKNSSISKTLSWLLRHAAVKEGLLINPEGFVKVSSIITHPKLVHTCTLDDILYIAETNDKQRFTVKQDDNNKKEWWIRANQGHTIEVNQLELEPLILSSNINKEYPIVVHGTYYKYWKDIKVVGLHRMQRNHIHFASGLPDGHDVISGMRRSCQLFIYVNLRRALENNLKFFKSTNGVILCPGDSNGYLRPIYFLKVVDARSGHQIQ